MKTIIIDLQTWIIEEKIEKFNFFGKVTPFFEKTAPQKKVYILGDADGSFCRIACAALLSGFISITPQGLKLLKILLKEENATLLRAEKEDNEGNNSLSAFQANKSIFNAIEMLLANMEYKRSNHKLICLGDLLFDRLTNNLNANLKIIENLYDLGVIFIKGNHDYLDAIDHDWAGYGAYRNKDEEDKNLTKTVIDKCYRLAYYDKEQNILYTHAALGKLTNNMIKYCHLELDYKNVNNLKDEINKIEGGIDYEYLQDFRPGSTDYDLQQEDKYIPKDFLHVHGHQDTVHNMAEDHVGKLHRQDLVGVMGINPRNKEGFMPVFICISY